MPATAHDCGRALNPVLVEGQMEGSAYMGAAEAIMEEQIFKDAMTTAAAIDRVVHHSVILELNVPRYRAEAAQRRTRKKASAAVSPDATPA